MKGLQGERLRQAFRYMDKDGDGYIKSDDFKRIIMVRFYGSIYASLC
jgi:solute carrier family 25 aspartate/glutamate transporter 12/13